MTIRKMLVAGALLSSLCSAAQAEILASGPVYGGPLSVGGSITCRIFNPGLVAVAISVRQIFTNTNVPIVLASDTCGVALAPNRYCAFTGRITGNFAHSCKLIVTGVEVDLRGVAEAQNGGAAVLNTMPID